MSDHVAALGFGLMMGDRAASAAAADPVFGFTSPTVIYDKQREIDSDAKDIGPKVLTYAANEAALVDAWRRFDADWRPFYAKYAGDPAKVLPEGRIAALLYTDELAAQTNAFAERLAAIKNAYESLKDANGRPLPPPNVPTPRVIPEPRPEPPSSGWTLPWWVWTLGGVALVGGGYYLYRTYIGKPLEIAKSLGRDPEPAPARSSRTPSRWQGSPEPVYPQGIPLSVADVAHHPAPAQHVVYRPYEHPHVVAERKGRSYGRPHVVPQHRDPPELPFRSSLDGYRDPGTEGDLGGYDDDYEPEW